jgi:hypothetical protein
MSVPIEVRQGGTWVVQKEGPCSRGTERFCRAAVHGTSSSTSVFASTRLRFDPTGVGEVHGAEAARCGAAAAVATRHMGAHPLTVHLTLYVGVSRIH